MVDLKGQYLKIKKEIDHAIQRVIDSTAFVKGPQVQHFENALSDYIGVKNSIACANGTDALQIALMALNLKPGDEVITADFTFISTVEVIALLGLKPVLVDTDYNSFLIKPIAIEKAITSKTKAIIPVHLFGQNADMEAILNIAKKYNLYVIEDAAQSIGSDYWFKDGTKKKSGNLGHIACTSFFPSKNLGCYGDGGSVFTNDEDMAGEIRCIANHGMRKRYYHDRVGVNSRLDGIQAAILHTKLTYLDDYCRARKEAAEFYDSSFASCSELKIPYRVENSSHVYHQYTLKVKNGKREALKEYLARENIPSMIYYPVPLHAQKVFADFKANDNDFPITQQLCEEVISLPMHTELSQEQQLFIIEKVLNFFK